MALYAFQCTSCGHEFDHFAKMNEVWHACPGCPQCHGVSRRVFTAPHFSEDRTRFFRGASGTRFSHALGQEMPDTRREYHRILDSKGIEPVSRREMPQTWKDAAQYAKHVREGGDHVDPASVVPKEPVEGVKSIRDYVRENPQKFRTA